MTNEREEERKQKEENNDDNVNSNANTISNDNEEKYNILTWPISISCLIHQWRNDNIKPPVLSNDVCPLLYQLIMRKLL